MSTPSTLPPESPPVGPVIPIGLGTKLGIATGTLGIFLAALFGVLNGDHTPETITGLVIGGLSFIRTVDGRSKQAAAIYSTGRVQ